MTINGPAEEQNQPRWEQPRFGPQSVENPPQAWAEPQDFESQWAGQYAAGYTGQFAGGPVLLPATRIDVPPPSVEERRLGVLRALIWPLALILCLAAHTWVPLLILPLVVGGIVRRRLHELRRQRLMLASTLR
jgi:hypothetical protein